MRFVPPGSPPRRQEYIHTIEKACIVGRFIVKGSSETTAQAIERDVISWSQEDRGKVRNLSTEIRHEIHRARIEKDRKRDRIVSLRTDMGNSEPRPRIDTDRKSSFANPRVDPRSILVENQRRHLNKVRVDMQSANWLVMTGWGVLRHQSQRTRQSQSR